MKTFTLGMRDYTLSELQAALDGPTRLELSDEAAAAIIDGAAYVQSLVESDEHVYGVNTGFGSLCEVRVGDKQLADLQHNHVLSHAAGVGEPVSPRTSKMVMLAKMLTFRSGRTGITVPSVQRLMDLWNADLIPVIPSKGTVGASGDLAPLAHMSLPLLGEGHVWVAGEMRPSAEMIAAQGWGPLNLNVKEGLALTNGIQYIASRAALELMRLGGLLDACDAVASLSGQAFSVAKQFCHPSYHKTTKHLERRQVARHVRFAMEGGNHHTLPSANKSFQDPYSFRCIPQVHGAARQLFGFAKQTIENELNGISDNPLFFAEEELALYGGNLHGQSTAFCLDILAMAATDLASISERRTYQLLSGRRGLPDFLVSEAGVNSGLMLIQYTAASMVNECKTLCHPCSVDTIPTCQLQEDHVSMGGTGATKLTTIIDNLYTVLAIEWITASQAIDLQPELELSVFGQSMHYALRRVVPTLINDRILSTDINAAREMLIAQAPIWSAQFANAEEKAKS